MARKTVGELALFGGEPLFRDALHVGRPNLGRQDRLFERLEGILERRWLTNHGELVQEFEERLAERLGVKHCLAICNGTVALELALRAAGVEGEVVVPSFTFVATAHSVDWIGHEPVFGDVAAGSHNIDPVDVEGRVTPRTGAILATHVWGVPCDVEGLEEVAARNDLRLIFDAAHAFGCSRDGQMVGGFGDAEVLSFHATKFVNSFEGGAVTTNDDALADRIVKMRNFGFTGADAVETAGTNGKMTEICAAMGLTSLESMDRFVEQNRLRYGLYRDALEGLEGVELLAYDEGESQNYQYVVVEVESSGAGLSRDSLLAVLQAEGVLARRYFYPGCHRLAAYRRDVSLPETERLSERVLVLPTGTGISTQEVEQVGELIRFAVARGGEVRAQMEQAGSRGRAANR